MGRRRSGRLNKTVRVLPKTAETIEAARNALGIFEGAFVDQAIAAYSAQFPALLALQEKKLTEIVDTLASSVTLVLSRSELAA